MKEYETGALRDTGGKGRMDLMPWSAIMRVSKHMEKGSEDHGERNWEKGLPMHCFMDSAFRHMAKYMEGWTDEDHLCAAAWNLLCAMWTEENKPEMQDIPTRKGAEKSFKQQLLDLSSNSVECETDNESPKHYSRYGHTEFTYCKYYNDGLCFAFGDKDRKCDHDGIEERCYIGYQP